MIRVLSVLLIAYCCSAVAAQSPEERLDAVQEFRRFFRSSKVAQDQVEAVRTLEGMECAEAADELIGLLDHPTPEVARTVRSVLATYREPATFAAYTAQIPELKDQARLANLIGVLGASGIRDAFPSIVARVIADGKKASPEVRFAAARVMAANGYRDGVEPMLRPMFGDGDPLARMAGVDAAGTLRIKELGTDIVPLLDDGSWQVQIAAVKALASLREPAAIGRLIELLGEGGRCAEEAADALFTITGLDFGMDAAGWSRTWERLKKQEGWRIPTDEELAKKAASRKKYDALYGKADATQKTTFGGIPTTSTKILFIIDVSGSMADLVVEREKFDAGYEDFEKLTIVKTELQRTIDSLGPDVLFNIVAFASDTDTWKKHLARANIVNKSSAKTWVGKLKAIGGPEAQSLAAAGLGGAANLAAGKTNTYKALMFPFGIDPDAKRPATGEEGAMSNPIDTVFFLSDGRPSTGKYTDTAVILDEVRRLNDRYRMVFHSIAIGEFQKEFLRALAETNGGVFVDLGR